MRRTSDYRGTLCPLNIAGAFLVVALVAARPAAGEPAPVIAASPDNYASGSRDIWNFAATDVTFKAARNEIWILDSYTLDDPLVRKFSVDDLQTPLPFQQLILPSSLIGGVALGLAEIPHGEFEGNNLLLVDPAFGTGGTPDPQFVILDDDGQPVPGLSPAPVIGLPGDVQLSTIDVNPDREEIAAYDLTNHQVFVLDFTFSVVGAPVPVLGRPNLFVGAWGLGGSLRGGGVGIAYSDPDTILVASGFYNVVETRFALEYDVGSTEGYTGRALDLSGAGFGGQNPDLAFMALARGRRNDEEVVAAINYGNDALYLFAYVPDDQQPPVDLLTCGRSVESGQYVLEWNLEPDLEPDALHVLENGVTRATLPGTETSYISPTPLVGKAFVEVAAEKDGVVSDLRAVCEVENTALPQLEGVQFDANQVTDRGGILGVAVTKTPASAAEFRAYLLGRDSNAVSVFDHTLESLGTFQPEPLVVSAQNNLAARGVALTELEGEAQLVILDSDGFAGDGVPGARFHALGGDMPGQLTLEVPAIDLSQFAPQPFLLDWDVDPDGNFIAGAVVNNDYAVVKIEFDGTALTGTEIVPLPHRSLTPFTSEPINGMGVSVLPNGNLLVAGSDTFPRTYTEALLITPLTGDPDTSARIVGYTQGLVVSGQFALFGAAPLGPDIGPRSFEGLDTAWFPPASDDSPGIGVSYISTPDVLLVRGRTSGLQITGQLLIHSTTECAHPELAAEQLTRVSLDVAPAGQEGTGSLAPSFADSVEGGIDYFYYVINPSETAEVTVGMQVLLGGVSVAGTEAEVTIPAGRYFRGTLRDREESTLEVVLDNPGESAVQVTVIAGAMGIVPEESTSDPVFLRADCNADGVVQLTDAVFGLNWLFLSGDAPGCRDACDSNDDGAVNLTDMVLTLNHLFLGGPPPEAPGITACGPDPTDDDGLAECVYPPASCP